MIFNKLYDIAKKRDAIIHVVNKDNFLAWEVSYHNYISSFENTEDIEERYQLSKTISNLLYWQDEYLIEKGYIGISGHITEEDEAEYKQTQMEFENLHDR